MTSQLHKNFLFATVIVGILLPLNLFAQSLFMKSIPIYGKAPASVIPIVNKNDPTPIEYLGNFFQPVILSNYNPDSLSGWNQQNTMEEKHLSFQYLLKEDPTDSIGVNERWACGDRTLQEQMNLYGLSNAEEFVKTHKTSGGLEFSLKKLSFGRVPACQASTVSNNKDAHSVIALLEGMDPLNFNDWSFWSSYTDKQVFPGDPEMDGNSPVSIGLEAYVKSSVDNTSQFGYISDIVSWNLKNGIATLNSYRNYMLTLQNPNIIKIHVGALEKLIVDSGKYPDGTVLTPEFLQSHGYKAIPDTSKENTTLHVNLSYFASDTVKLSNTHYTFSRKFYSWIYSGGVTKLDSTTQQIEVDKVTSVEEDVNKIPQEFVLYQNYPNPFNPSTTIKFSIPTSPVPSPYQGEGLRERLVTLKVYDLLGREVATLVNEEKAPGNYEVNFSAEGGLPSGVYFYTLHAGNYTETKKMLLMK